MLWLEMLAKLGGRGGLVMNCGLLEMLIVSIIGILNESSSLSLSEHKMSFYA